MPVILNTDEVEERDRAEFVHEALGATMVPIELHWPGHRRSVAAHGAVTDLGDLTVCAGRTTALRVERTTALARDSMEPSIFINVQLSGSSIVVQHDREAVLRPGELVMYDSTSPYTLLNDTGMTGNFFRIPHSALAMPNDMKHVRPAARAAADAVRCCPTGHGGAHVRAPPRPRSAAPALPRTAAASSAVPSPAPVLAARRPPTSCWL